MKKILLGITTFNRKEIVEKMAQSLRVANKGNCKTIVFDDCSSEFDKEWLSKLFTGAEIFINTENRCADMNLYSIYDYFLKTDADIFFTLDSDLIFHPNFVKIGLDLIEKTDGILSLYNSFKHSSYGSILCNEEKILLKKHVGAAGVIFTRDVLKKIIENVPPSRRFDWDWSAFLEVNDIRIMVTDVSYIQHIGFFGYNTKHTFEMDFGYRFSPANKVNYDILMELLETSIIEGNLALKEKLIELYNIRETVSWKITSPLRWLGKRFI